ncbi:hypothetical protein NKI46_01065 [Mesorhizobium sp. M0615]|uniref:hypothetical protein n=1 Tax=Mesorhizobium sp. M0615 TaxID=2956971 RepID=UPI00333ADA08
MKNMGVTIDRRRVLFGAGTVVAALGAIPATAGPGRAIGAPEVPDTAPTLPQPPLARLHALHDELCELVEGRNQHCGGKWELRVRAPAGDGYPPIVYMNVGSIAPRDRFEMARREFIDATKAMHPGIHLWTVHGEDFTGDLPGFSLIYGQRVQA